MFKGEGGHMNIDLFVTDVQIATDNHSFSLRLQRLAVFLEGLLIHLCLIVQAL